MAYYHCTVKMTLDTFDAFKERFDRWAKVKKLKDTGVCMKHGQAYIYMQHHPDKHKVVKAARETWKQWGVRAPDEKDWMRLDKDIYMQMASRDGILGGDEISETEEELERQIKELQSRLDRKRKARVLADGKLEHCRDSQEKFLKYVDSCIQAKKPLELEMRCIGYTRDVGKLIQENKRFGRTGRGGDIDFILAIDGKSFNLNYARAFQLPGFMDWMRDTYKFYISNHCHTDLKTPDGIVRDLAYEGSG
jgi:hypothetical protein